jgi:hypothetical protein
VEECFTAHLIDSYGDGWNNAVMVFKEEGTDEAVLQLTQSYPYTNAFQAQVVDFCLDCGTCYDIQFGGGDYPEETSWKIKDADGLVQVEGANAGTATFCTSICTTTVCEEGKQPNEADDGCVLCEAGKHSGTNSNAACTRCAAGKYGEEGATSEDACQVCDSGTASGEGAGACSTCPSGTYANAAIGAWECVDCEKGTFSAVRALPPALLDFASLTLVSLRAV